MLREDGYEVEVAWDGASAIGRLTRSPPPDVLVTDLNLPHADGGAVSEYARSRRPLLPIVIMTGYPELAARLDRALSPMPIVLTKPLEYARLTDALRDVVRFAG
jgi:two-component system response regulator MprA